MTAPAARAAARSREVFARTARRAVQLAFAALALTAVAQAQRAPCFLTVRGPDGGPLAGAEVTCVGAAALGPNERPDVCRATSDDRGRARCELLVGRLYAAWAVGPADGEGRRHVTEREPLVAAGRVLELHALDARTPTPLALAGHEAWREPGAVALRWFPDAGGAHAVDLPWPAGDAVELPPSPWTNGRLALVDAAGEQLATSPLAAGATALSEFRAPVAVTVEVVDDAGAPLAGVVLEHPIATWGGPATFFLPHLDPTTRLRVAGRTDRTGTATVHVPATRKDDLLLLASKERYATEVRAVGSLERVEVRLRPRAAPLLRVTGAASTGVDVVAIADFRLELARGGTAYGDRSVTVEPREKGVWAVLSGGAEFQPIVTARGPRPTAIVVEPVASTIDDVTIDLAAMRAVEVTAVDATSSPCWCALGVERLAAHGDRWVAAIATDSAGRATLRLPRGEFCVYATTGLAHAAAIVGGGVPAPLELRLEPLPTMRVKVTDASGRPIAGARVVGRSSGERRRFPEPPKTDLERQLERLASSLWRDYAGQARSGADGVVDIPVFTFDGMQARVEVRRGDATCEPFVLEAGGETAIVLGPR